MKHILSVILLIFSGLCLMGQTNGEVNEGTISFITSQNVYVKFKSTENISVGDTLFLTQEAKLISALVVKDLSSISCVCTLIGNRTLAIAQRVSTRMKKVMPEKAKEVPVEPLIQTVVKIKDTVAFRKELPKKLKQNVSGRISLSSYSNFSGVQDFSQRMRYTLTLNADHIKDSKFSAETYISFVHKFNDLGAMKNNIFNGLKIYNLALSYAINKNQIIWAGRKINPRLSSMGAIDGIQYEAKIKSLTFGIVGGSRPDYMDYSFNPKLMQTGAYLGHDLITKNGNIQSSLALVEQQNNGITDRRFAYFQHSNSWVKNLYFFGSAEFDLFNKVMNVTENIVTQDNKPKLSNLYVSLRYRVVKALSLSLSYSARKNIIYYETYKSIVDRLLEEATTEGYVFQANFRPGKNISLGTNTGYRFSRHDPKPTKNLYSYLTFNRVPWLNVSTTLSATLLETSYLSLSSIYSLGFSRDLVEGKLDAGINYRYVHYKFRNTELPLVQHMAEMNMTWRMMKKLSGSLNFEGTFQKKINYNSIYINITQRF